MRIKLFWFSLFLFFLFSIPSPLFAQSNMLTEKNVKCLKNRPEDKGNSQSLTWHDPPTPQSLPKYLTGTFIPGSTVYTVACIGTGEGRKCGTGDKALDDELFAGTIGLGRGDYLINVTFNNPKQIVDNTGVVNVDAVVGGTAQPKGAYDFFGVEVVTKVDNTIAGQGALQQGVFKFLQMDGKDCAKLSWTHHDPYGIVFDSVSLEPIGNVIVTINDESGKPLENNPVLRNNTPTLEDGVYNYLVPPGKYIMTVKLPTGYQFVTTPKANSNMTSVYDFIDENEAKSHCTIYTPGEIIDEQPDMPECRNIPLEPVSVKPLIKEPVSILYSFEKNENAYTIKGKVSHPMATAVVTQLINASQKIELGRVVSNHSGYYSLEIPLANILPDAPLEVTFIKHEFMNATSRSLKNNTFTSLLRQTLIKEVSATTPGKTSLMLDPLPAYIEGYAMDINSQIIPHALVQVLLKNGDGLYFETKADANGYFFIAPHNLPTATLNLEFHLAFVTPEGKTIPYKIYEFTRANKYYFAKEGINLLTGTKNGKPAEPKPEGQTKLEIAPLTQKEQRALQQKGYVQKQRDTNTQALDGQSPLAAQNQKIQQVILIVVVLVILGTVGLIVAVGTFKKKIQL